VIRADVTRGSGCGTCVFEEPEEAQLVLKTLNGHQVSQAVPMDIHYCVTNHVPLF